MINYLFITYLSICLSLMMYISMDDYIIHERCRREVQENLKLKLTKIFACDNCNFETTEKCDLLIHRKNAHTDQFENEVKVKMKKVMMIIQADQLINVAFALTTLPTQTMLLFTMEKNIISK